MIDYDLTKLNKFDKKTLAEIWNTLNGWEWHELLGDKPEHFDDMLDFHRNKNYKLPTKKDIIDPIARSIRVKIGEKECLRWLHINKFNKTNFEFEKWWFKRTLQKIFRAGFYSPKMKKAIRDVLSDIADKNQEENAKNRFK